jgi:GMP synthase-like glutamine amidotransferase
MNIAVLQHAPHEGPGVISAWAHSRGHEIAITEVSREAPPAVESIDLLVIMGGAMNVYQEDEYPWLAGEKAFIAAVIQAGKAVLGVCLGAQLLAVVLGGKVAGNGYKEIGWFPVELTDEGRDLKLLDGFPNLFIALHWHGDTFSIPEDSVHFASSAACRNQGFAYDQGRVVGLQFHLEVTREMLARFVEEDAAELVPGEWIATPEELLAADAPFQAGNDLLFLLLDRLAEKAGA